MSTLRDRIRGALWCSLVSDALSMPVHWYYNPSDISAQFGRISSYVAPHEFHPQSIMPQSNTLGGGRAQFAAVKEVPVVGGVILKGKEKYWGSKPYHYHYGMKPGQNTLNSLCLRLLIRSINACGKYDPDHFLKEYVEFMTKKDSHNDVYAESFHRDFFRNWSKGIDPKNCAGEEGHNTPVIGGLVMLAAVILLNFNDRTRARELAIQHLRLTHKSPKLEVYVLKYVDLLLDALHSSEKFEDFVAKHIDTTAKTCGFSKFSEMRSELEDTEFIGNLVSSACYIEYSFPCTLFLIGKHGNSIEQCLIANVNVGGENCHRGSVVGALVGALNGFDKIPEHWITDLHDRKEIEAEIESFLNLILPEQQSEN
jgi:ADP-ribosyl-[dinitrogen reductase] hydrolase